MAEINAEDVYKKLDIIDVKVGQVLIWKAKHETAHELLERDIGDSRAAIFENPGLISKVSTLWNCKKDTTKWKEFWFGILRYLVVAVIVGVVAWLLVLYKGT